MNKETPLRILGIDPGSRIAGFAIIEEKKTRPSAVGDFKIVTVGAFKLNLTLPHYERIGHLHRATVNLIEELKPTVCIIEKAFVGINLHSALKLGEARGALISAVREFKLPLHEVSPTQVKKTLTGMGHATKEQVSLALKTLMKFDQGGLPFDATDALAIALYYGLIHPFNRQAKSETTSVRILNG